VSGALLTDFYQFTMAQAYFALGMQDTAVFEIFVRRLPRERHFLIAAGLEQALTHLERWRFDRAELDYLSGLGKFTDAFLEHLAGLRFTGSVHAMPEGTPFFADEPILRVTAPIIEAQLLESRLLNLVHFQTLIASKAARCVIAAPGRRLVDFGMRRAHGGEAALHASRAAYLAGFHATATVEAGREFGIPLAGTMAHSFIEAHDDETTAMANFLRVHHGDTALLIDTYDTARGARRAARLARDCVSEGRPTRVRSVRIDSGDLDVESRRVRAILDAEGAPDVGIMASGNLDEYRIDALIRAGAPIDVFGVGTHLDVSKDVPALDMAYKLQEYAGRARRKRSAGKQTWPGAKQVFREPDTSRAIGHDRVAGARECLPGDPLLREVMRAGVRQGVARSLNQSREYCMAQQQQLPAELRSLEPGATSHDVRIEDSIRTLAAQLDARAT
jgi:nicotinate phosphoribosyltransferase